MIENRTERTKRSIQDVSEYISKRKCILFIGAGVNASNPSGENGTQLLPPKGDELSKKLANGCINFNRDCGKDHRANLQKTSQFYEFDHSRFALIDFLQEEIVNGKIPSKIHDLLATMPFKYVLSTNYDMLYEKALLKNNKLFTLGVFNRGPKQEQEYHDTFLESLKWLNNQLNIIVTDNKLKQKLSKKIVSKIKDVEAFNDEDESILDLDPKEQIPFVYKIHGALTDDRKYQDSIIITEEDYIDFIVRMNDTENELIPRKIKRALQTYPILFIGYSLRDYNLRLLFKTLRLGVDPAKIPPSFAIDRYPDPIVERVFNKYHFFIIEDVWKCLPEIYKQVNAKQ